MENHHFQWENSLFHTISMAMFNSYVTNYQRVNLMLWNEIPINWPIRHDPTSKSSNFLMPGGGHSTGATIATWVTWWEKNRRMSEGFGTVQDVSKLLKNATGRSSIPLCLGFWIILGMAERWHGMIMNDPKSIARFLGRSSASMRGLYRWSSTLTYRSNGDGLWPQMAGLPTSTNVLKHPKTSLLGAENPPF